MRAHSPAAAATPANLTAPHREGQLATARKFEARASKTNPKIAVNRELASIPGPPKRSANAPGPNSAPKTFFGEAPLRRQPPPEGDRSKAQRKGPPTFMKPRPATSANSPKKRVTLATPRQRHYDLGYCRHLGISKVMKSSVFRKLIPSLVSASLLACAEARIEEASPTEVAQRPVLLFTFPPFRRALHDPRAPLEFCFSKLIDPQSIRPGLAHLSSGSVNLDSEIGLDLVDYQYALGLRPYRQPCPGSVLWVRSIGKIAAETSYRLRLFDEIRDLKGRKVNDRDDRRWLAGKDGKRRLYLEFKSAPPGEPRPTEPGPGKAPPQPPSTLRELFAPNEVFAAGNPSCSCHRTPQSLAFDRLNLSSPEVAHHALLNGKSGNEMAWVAPGYPEHSYLIRKLLRDQEGHALPGVLGDPMPPAKPLMKRDLARIMAWIEKGAQL